MVCFRALCWAPYFSLSTTAQSILSLLSTASQITSTPTMSRSMCLFLWFLTTLHSLVPTLHNLVPTQWSQTVLVKPRPGCLTTSSTLTTQNPTLWSAILKPANLNHRTFLFCSVTRRKIRVQHELAAYVLADLSAVSSFKLEPFFKNQQHSEVNLTVESYLNRRKIFYKYLQEVF